MTPKLRVDQENLAKAVLITERIRKKMLARPRQKRSSGSSGINAAEAAAEANIVVKVVCLGKTRIR